MGVSALVLVVKALRFGWCCERGMFDGGDDDEAARVAMFSMLELWSCVAEHRVGGGGEQEERGPLGLELCGSYKTRSLSGDCTKKGRGF